MKLRELELEIKNELAAGGFGDAGYEARQLLSGILGISTSELLLRDQQQLDEHVVFKARGWVAERLRGIPLAYLTGVKGFYRHEFFVEPGVLVPRPESEHVIEVALSRVCGSEVEVRRIADLGCGSGILGLSLLVEFPSARLLAVDRSPVAARVTARNAAKLGVGERCEIAESAVDDVKSPSKFELIVANPPYIQEGDPSVQRSVHQHEPHEALYSDEQGLGAIRRWTEWAALHLQSGGVFVCEIGAGQSAQVQVIMGRSGFRDIKVQYDLAGHDRIVSALRGE